MCTQRSYRMMVPRSLPGGSCRGSSKVPEELASHRCSVRRQGSTRSSRGHGNSPCGRSWKQSHPVERWWGDEAPRGTQRPQGTCRTLRLATPEKKVLEQRSCSRGKRVLLSKLLLRWLIQVPSPLTWHVLYREHVWWENVRTAGRWTRGWKAWR